MQPGTQLGHYEIVSALGKGGMGEVWRARDSKLGREVAIKTLPEEFAQDEERLARFEREAKLLASLNHPNIATIHGLEEDSGIRFLVLELVEGDTLAERLKRGAIPVEESLKLALQIAEALEAAHEKGVIHRDLKPANIKVTPDGKIKVLDFGLAKAFAGDGSDANLSQSPTVSMAATQQGVILGTAAYMSPEQARGQEVDKRADAWAFGCVLYEMLTGRQVFKGELMSDVMASVLKSDPDYKELPPRLHPKLRDLLRRCLEKEPKQRWQDVGDVRVEIGQLLASPEGLLVSTEVSAGVAPPRLLFLPVTVAVLVTALIGGLVVWALWPVPARTVTRFSVELEGQLGVFQAIELSPDGQRIVYSVNGQLYSHRMDQAGATVIPGTERGLEPFFSPDSQSVAFFAENQLRTVDFTGEAPRVLADITGMGNGGLVGAWDREGRIFFGQAGRYGLFRVPAVGGVPEPFADLGDYQDLDYPDVLPGGEWVLYSAQGSGEDWSNGRIVARQVDTGEQKVVLEGGHFARYLPTGHLVFARNGTLFAVAFDADRVEVTGTAVPLVQGVATDETSGHAKYAVASNGTLIYVPGVLGGGGKRPNTIVRVGREGEGRALTVVPRIYNQPRVSPDGKRVAVEVADPTPGSSTVHLWVISLDETGDAIQLTFEGSENRYPVWTLDSHEVVFLTDRDSGRSLYRKSADGIGPAELVLAGSDLLVPTDVMRGNVLVFQDEGDGGGRDILTLELDGDGSMSDFLATPADERSARISPDGKWMVYVSDESGQNRVYARPYPSTAGTQRGVSEGEGLAPVWAADGREIYYISGTGIDTGLLMAVPVQVGPTLTPSTPLRLFPFFQEFFFRSLESLESAPPYDALPNDDGLVAVDLAGAVSSDAGSVRTQVNVILNWFEEVKELAPVP